MKLFSTLFALSALLFTASHSAEEEGGIRVGTSVTWPGHIEAGTVNSDHVSLTMDIYSTLAGKVPWQRENP